MYRRESKYKIQEAYSNRNNLQYNPSGLESTKSIKETDLTAEIKINKQKHKSYLETITFP